MDFVTLFVKRRFRLGTINRGRLNATYFAIICKFVRPIRELRIGKFVLLHGRGNTKMISRAAARYNEPPRYNRPRL